MGEEVIDKHSYILEIHLDDELEPVLIPLINVGHKHFFLKDKNCYSDQLIAIGKWFKYHSLTNDASYNKYINERCQLNTNPLSEDVSSIKIDSIHNNENLVETHSLVFSELTDRDQVHLYWDEKFGKNILNPSNNLDFNSTEYFFLTKNSNGLLKKWSVQDQCYTKNYNTISSFDKIIGVRTSVDKNNIFFFNDQNLLFKWSVSQEKTCKSYNIDLQKFIGYEISPNGLFAIFFGKDSSLTKYIFDDDKFEILSESQLISTTCDLKTMRITNDSQYVYLAYKNGELVLFDITLKDIIKRFGIIHNPLCCVKLDTTGEILFTGGFNELKLFSLSKRILFKRFTNISKATIHSIEVSSNEYFIFIGDSLGYVKQLCGKTGEVQQDYGQISDKQIWKVFLTYDNKFLFTFDANYMLKLWSGEEVKLIKNYEQITGNDDTQIHIEMFEIAKKDNGVEKLMRKISFTKDELICNSNLIDDSN